MTLPWSFSNGTNADATQVNDNFSYVQNIFHHGGNELVGKSGTIYIPVIINNVTNAPDVYLYIRGLAAGSSSTAANHGGPEHAHDVMSTESILSGTKIAYNTGGNGTHRHTVPESGTNLVNYQNVPQQVKIYIDGVDMTSTIANPNGKGSTMYNVGTPAWGNSSLTAWDSGKLTLTSAITWTAGEHSIELKETGAEGGTLVYHLSVNAGF